MTIISHYNVWSRWRIVIVDDCHLCSFQLGVQYFFGKFTIPSSNQDKGFDFIFRIGDGWNVIHFTEFLILEGVELTNNGSAIKNVAEVGEGIFDFFGYFLGGASRHIDFESSVGECQKDGEE